MRSLLFIYYQLAALLLCMIGFYLLVVTPNIIKKIIGINIMETAIFLFIISLGKFWGGKKPPVLLENIPLEEYITPLPQQMVILGVLMTLGVTTFALVLLIEVYSHYHTLNADKLRKMM